VKSEDVGWSAPSSVDTDAAAYLAKRMIADGATGIGLCGTTGESAALLWPMRRRREFRGVAVATGALQNVMSRGREKLMI
jgi:dihydrodipicolinate synthase/N-acetylneuraminate lyase